MDLLRQVLDGAVIGEGTARTLKVASVTVDDGAGGTRYLTAPEAALLTLRLSDPLDAAINGLDHVTLIPGHGSYDTATGVLLVALGPDDNPIVSDVAPGLAEIHTAFVRLPGAQSQWVEILYSVRNTASLP